MIADLASKQVPETVDADIVIVGSGLVGVAVASRLVGRRRKIVMVEAGGRRIRTDQQRRYWDGSLLDTDPQEWFYPVHAGRIRAFGGASRVWGGRSTPLFPWNFDGPAVGPDDGWAIPFQAFAAYLPDACKFLYLGENDFDHVPGRHAAPWLSNPHIFEGIEKFSLPANAAKHYQHSVFSDPDLTVMLNAPAVEIVASAGGRRAQGVRIRTATGAEVFIKAKYTVVSAGGLESARLLLASGPPGASFSLGNEHDQIGRYLQTHFWGRVGKFRLPRRLANRLCFPEQGADGVYFMRYLSLSARERDARNLLSLAIRPTWGSIGDPSHGSGVYSLAYMMRHFVPQELQYRLNFLDRRTNGSRFSRSLGHLRNIMIDSPAVTRFAATMLYHKLISRPAAPGFLQPSANDEYSLEFSAEQAPNPESRVVRLKDRDPLGMPKIGLQWRRQEIDQRSVRENLTLLRNAMNLAAETVLLTDAQIDEASESLYPAKGHHMGTLRMSATPRTGATDANAQVWGVSDLYVAGSALFPTSGFGNPTLPAVALALRLGDHLV